MAQIIKHRRGGIAALKDVTARVGEFVMATGSIANLNGPMVFIGESEGVAGAYRPVSKIYQGSTAPTIDVGAYGSVIDGTPFYATSNKTLYILSKDGNSNINLTGNIEGNTISGVTINNLTGTTINLSNSGNRALNITGDIVQTGSFYTSGDIVLRGNINIGDNLTGDTLTLNSEISSSMIPDSNNNFDLGTSSKFWRNLYVSGTGYINNLQANEVSFNNLGVSGNLSVTGSQYLNQNLFVGGNGKITGSLEVVGATNLDSTLTVTGSSTFKNDLNVIGVLTVTGETRLQSNLYVSGNLEVLGSSTNINLQSNTVNIGDNIIQVNAYSPFDRYAGLSAYDSGSAGLSGSFLWDSVNDYWLIQNSNANTGRLVSVTTGSIGSEISLTNGTFPIATSNGTIGDSLLTYTGTTFALNTNKFSVDSGTGNTTIAGNLTLSNSGGADNALSSSAIVFRNSSNILGYVSTTATTDVMDGILGYKNSNGALVFSTVIDGGSYV
jgi:hypothetical protein